MTETERELTKRWMDTWAKAAPELQKVRDADIRAADTAESMQVFTGSAAWAVKHRPAAAWSGLVEQQRWFAKAALTS
ncbi:MAG: hypothetical protein IPK32_02260 [Verrucomicrobiaceae bacterium]|nr:hypothetical protein [Verrucomicrobiaceae bacterium]